jgi:hypothetical protein
MGRRLGFFDHLLRDMERSAQRRASEAARADRQLQSMQRRAFERELIRQKREQERARVQAERQALVHKQQSTKEAQIAAWRAEYELHQEVERQILTPCNDAPELAERSRLFEGLMERNEYQPPAYVSPPPVSPDRASWEQRRAQHMANLDAEIEAVRPKTHAYLIATLLSVGAIVGGVALAVLQTTSAEAGVGIAGLGCVVLLVARGHSQASRREQLFTIRKQKEQALHVQLEQEWAAMVESARDLSTRQEAAAKAAYERSIAIAETKFVAKESERIAKLRQLLAGNHERMEQVLSELLPLDLPVACKAVAQITTSEHIVLELELPEPSMLPAQEAKLLQSGKVSYKDKSPKRLREEYSKFVAGIGLRHACEVMLHLPTVKTVQVEAWRTVTDGATGHPVEQTFLDLTCDYETVAALNMDGIDPIAALKNFRHQLGEGHLRRTVQQQSITPHRLAAGLS